MAMSDHRQTAAGAAPYALDDQRLRRSFTRWSGRYDEAAALPGEVAERLMEHLEPVRVSPRRVLDAGSGTGFASARLAARFRQARIFALDVSEAMLRLGRRRAPRWFSRHRFVCADLHRLPLADASIDLVASNLALPYCESPVAALRELHRVLRPGGLLAFSTFGPDTLLELREAWAAVDGYVHVHAFADMHDIGDALVSEGFADVVMDVERLTLHFASVDELLGELRVWGGGNAARGRARGLTGAGRLRELARAYERLRVDAGLPASYELVFGHAWSRAAGRVEVAPPRRAPSALPG